MRVKNTIILRKSERFSRYLMIFFIIYPMLSMYKFPGMNLPLSDVILILIFPVLIFNEWKSDGRLYLQRKVILMYISYIILNFTGLVLLNIVSISECAMRTARYIFYWTVLFFYNKNFKILDAIKIYRIASIFNVIVLLIQNVGVSIKGVYIPAHIVNPLIMSQLTIDGINEQVYNILNSTGRPFALFSEPSAVAYYLSGMLCIELFYIKKINYCNVLILTVGILFSMSSTGMLLMTFMWMIFLGQWLYRSRKITVVNIVFCLVFFMGAVGVCCVLVSSGRLDEFIRRLGSSNVWIGRFGGYVVFGEERGIIQTLFGCGMNDNYNVFLSGIPRTYYYFGVIGCFLLSIIIFVIILKASSISKVFILMLLLAETGGLYFYGQFILTVIPFIVLKGSRNEKDLFNNTQLRSIS